MGDEGEPSSFVDDVDVEESGGGKMKAPCRLPLPREWPSDCWCGSAIRERSPTATKQKWDKVRIVESPNDGPDEVCH